MSIRNRYMGLETEYGIDGGELNPFDASLLIINSYKRPELEHIIWDYDLEYPKNGATTMRDAREFAYLLDEPCQYPSDYDNKLIHCMVESGFRLYIDHAHPEVSTPETSILKNVLTWDKAGEEILRISCKNAEHNTGIKIKIYKNNTDFKGSSFGCHENYLVERKIPFSDISKHLIPFLVTRQIYTGAGKVGYDAGEPVHYQISQRADFITDDISLDTQHKRAIVNTRDEPHTDFNRYRRLHLILGDSNLSEYTTLLKVGTTSLVLSMIEDGYIDSELSLIDPVNALKQISRDLSFKKRYKLKNGNEMSAIEIQREYLTMATRYSLGIDLNHEAKAILKHWRYVLYALEKDPMLLCTKIDWVIKKRLLDFKLNDLGLKWNINNSDILNKLRNWDLRYHDLSERGFYNILLKNNKIDRIITKEERDFAVNNAPEDSRAYFIGQCLKRFPEHVFSRNWDSISLINKGKILRVPLKNLDKGTKKLTSDDFENSKSIEGLLKNIGIQGGIN